MKRFALLFSICLVFCMLSGCSEEPTLGPDQSTSVNLPGAVTVDPEVIASEIIARTGWVTESPAETDLRNQSSATITQTGYVLSAEREIVVDNIAHYSFEVQTGVGMYDKIRLHRVVMESRSNEPIRTRRSIFLQHGDLLGFAKFLFGNVSPSTPNDHAFAIFLAQNGVDVWGIDQNWVMVPQSTTDFSFMADWGLQNQVDNLNAGLAIAREVRVQMGNGWRKMFLLGYSSGVWTSYAYLNEETQFPTGHRQVAGFIPVEGYLKTDRESERIRDCALAAAELDSMNAGVYQDPTPILGKTVSMLAQMDPGGMSPIIPGFTNMQAALFFGAATWAIGGMECCYHFTGGIFDQYGIPLDLTYTPVDGWLDFLMNTANYMPRRWHQEMYAVSCNEASLPYDDHLSEITVPVHYIGAGGAFGDWGLYTLDLLGSSDITSTIVRQYPPELQILDIGHVDIWTATNSPALFWTPILDWINDHTPGKDMIPNKPKQ